MASRMPWGGPVGDGACQWNGPVERNDEGYVCTGPGRPAVRDARDRLADLRNFQWTMEMVALDRRRPHPPTAPSSFVAALDACITSATEDLARELRRC